MFCNNCGNTLGNEAKFCGTCGKPVVERDLQGGSQQKETEIVSSEGEDPKHSTWKNVLKWIIGGWAVLTLAGGGSSLFLCFLLLVQK